MDIQVKRGLETNRTTITPKMGEPVFTTDGKELFIGDGTTPGGIPVGAVKPSGTITQGQIASFADDTGKVIEGIDRASIIQGLATDVSVDSKITSRVPGIKVNNAINADVAAEAKQLNGRSDYLTPDNITSSYQEDDSTKIVSATGVHNLYKAVVGLLTGKIDKTSITTSMTSSSTTQVLAASVGKALKSLIDNANASIASLQSSIQQLSGRITTNANDIGTLKTDVSGVKTHLGRLPGTMSSGTGAPSGGSNGDVYIQHL